MFRIRSLMAGEGTTGTAGAGAAAGNDDKGTASAAGAAGAAAAGAGAAGAAAGAGAAGAVAGAGAAGAAAGAAGAAEGEKKTGSFLDGVAKKETDGKAQLEGAAKSADLDLKAPEGVTVDQKLFDGFKTAAKEAGLSSDSAQKVLNFYANAIKEAEKAQVTAAEQRQTDQRKALEAHPKIGGANLEKSQESARRAVLTLDKLGDGLGSRAVKALAEAGLGDHPDVAHLFAVLGDAIAEDSIGKRETAVTAPASQEERGRKRYAASLAAHARETKQP
jgi:hypothetical protein